LALTGETGQWRWRGGRRDLPKSREIHAGGLKLRATWNSGGMAEDLDLDVRLIRPGDRLTGMSLGDPAFTPLKTFLQKHSLEYERQSLGRTYAAFPA